LAFTVGATQITHEEQMGSRGNKAVSLLHLAWSGVPCLSRPSQERLLNKWLRCKLLQVVFQDPSCRPSGLCGQTCGRSFTFLFSCWFEFSSTW
jgi:hypothetical protein